MEAAEAHIQEAIYEKMGGYEEVIATCIGHTHIDVAWLWTVDQVRQKSCRSFATVLKLMEEYPDYHFMSSQPKLYSFVKERHPEMYQRIKGRVKEGRWEPEGGMWVKADCNLTSGESLVRQFQFGKRFFKEEFGVENKILWLPDVFGYSAALPQIMKKCGIEYFMTTKLAWNEFDKHPYDSFLWEGIDGSRIFTHLITTLGVGQSESSFFTTYNGMLHPDAIMGGWNRYQNKDINNDILVCFGYGDGGGGPTRDMMELELLSVLAEMTGKEAPAYPKSELDRMWELILTNQFHDILPGSSIKEVYDQTKKEYADIEKTSGELIDKRLASLTDEKEEAITVWNTLGHERNDLVELPAFNGSALTDGADVYPVQKTADGAVAYVKGIPSKGMWFFVVQRRLRKKKRSGSTNVRKADSVWKLRFMRSLSMIRVSSPLCLIKRMTGRCFRTARPEMSFGSTRTNRSATATGTPIFSIRKNPGVWKMCVPWSGWKMVRYGQLFRWRENLWAP